MGLSLRCLTFSGPRGRLDEVSCEGERSRSPKGSWSKGSEEREQLRSAAENGGQQRTGATARVTPSGGHHAARGHGVRPGMMLQEREAQESYGRVQPATAVRRDGRLHGARP